MINDKVQAAGAYFQELRHPMLALVRGMPKRVLELGCATGQTLAWMKRRGAQYTVGIEVSPEAAAVAQQQDINRIIRGDIERMELDFDPCSFDLVVTGHVLEHLTDPWTVLRRLRALLKDGGQLVGGLPNVRHQSIVLPLLLKGEWQYKPSGVMDWTHLRFFTAKSISALLKDSGFQVDRIEPEFGRRAQIANVATCHVFQNFLSYAYNFSAIKADP